MALGYLTRGGSHKQIPVSAGRPFKNLVVHVFLDHYMGTGRELI
jgi:hypothetical protein